MTKGFIPLVIITLGLLMPPAHAQMQTTIVTSPEAEAKLMAEKKAEETKANETAAKDAGLETHHVIVTPDKEPTDETGKTANTPSASTQPTALQSDKPILTPTKDLKPWGKSAALFTAQNGTKNRTASILTDFAREPGKVPPSGLFQIARLYADQGDMKMASRYYYAAQLRARFDYYRWPGRGAGTENPYLALNNMAQDLGPILGAWATQSSTRLANVMDDVRVWDAATPYDYHPGYVLPEDAPKEETWPDLLAKAREQFFHDGQQIVSALKTLGK